MNKLNVIILTIVSTSIILMGCESSIQKQKDWYGFTKAEIIKQSALKYDRIEIEFNKDSTFKTEIYYHSNHLFQKKVINQGVLRVDIKYSKDGKFELRREICDNGKWGFEGIFYIDAFYGLSTWKHCNGQINQQGIRFKNKKVGKWTEWNELGSIIEEIDYKNLPKISEMPKINQ